MGRHSGISSRASKKSALYYTTDCGGDENDNFEHNLQQRSVSLTALHTSSGSPQQQQLTEPRMAHLETLEAKMASIEVSLSSTPRRKKGGSVSGGMTSPAAHRNRDYYKELDSLRVALRDKENIIQTLKGQLCNTLSNRLALRNGAPPLTEADRKATEERLQRLRRDADNKRLAIKNLKLALERLDITDNIDVRIQQAELEYRLGREELELLSLREESRALQAAIELAETQEKQKNDTIFSCITGSTQITIHAVEVSADPKSPRFGAGPREDAAGLYVDWAIEDSGLCKGDRILEVNGKLVVGAGRSDLARLLAVAPDAAQIVVLRKNESLAALRTLRSDNLRLTHRISYLEEQVRDLLAPRTEMPVDSSTTAVIESPPARKDHLQVFQKGPQVTALISSMGPGLTLKGSPDTRQSLPNVKAMSGRHSDYSSTEALSQPRTSRSGRHSSGKLQHQHLAKSTASLDLMQQQQHYQLHNSSMMNSSSPRRQMQQQQQKSSRSKQQQMLEFDSEPTYYRMQDNQSRASEHSEASTTAYSSQEYSSSSNKSRPAPPKKPLRLSLHRAASLQSVESAPPTTSSSNHHHHQYHHHHHQDMYTPSKKPTKRNYRGDPPVNESQQQEAPQPPPRTPSRAESCQSALRWPSPKPRPHLTQLSMEKWC
ncbi:uncharacterized protein LOC100123965 isoform X2 [Nasonia vitripennis]|uniref:PDZ domain-containing protein n=1 Tax=Nasonia vitripennis TaxID=7425 RepID=A0A7M7QJL7_NASVI|nr:uncharacterized protein LOC100123965 isoform X2 [Nasonia vitripennis]